MNETDTALRRATEIFLGDLTDEFDMELGQLLPTLVAAGYVTTDGESESGHHWRFTEAGIARQESLGLLD